MKKKTIWVVAVLGTGAGAIIILLALSAYVLTNERNNFPLNFRERNVDLGLFRVGVDRDQPRHAFGFTVEGEKPVRIVDINTSCSCFYIGQKEDLIGKELRPGDKGEIVLQMSVTASQAGAREEYAEIVTDPPSREPIYLSLKAFVEQPVNVTPNPVLLETVEGHLPPECRILINRLRDADSQKLVLNPTDSDFGPFELVKMETSSESRPFFNFIRPPYMDQIELHLRTDKCFPMGRHKVSLRLVWKGDIPSTEVPVIVNVMPSISVIPSRLFLGEMSPAEEKSESILLIANDPSQHVEVEGVECDLPFVHGSVDANNNRVVLQVVAPQNPGRFEGTAIIRVAGTAKPLSCTVSGLVRQADVVQK